MINNKLFEKEGPIFMGSNKTNMELNVGIFGVNYDGTTSYLSLIHI